MKPVVLWREEPQTDIVQNLKGFMARSATKKPSMDR